MSKAISESNQQGRNVSLCPFFIACIPTSGYRHDGGQNSLPSAEAIVSRLFGRMGVGIHFARGIVCLKGR
ncbi:MAG: hypothetical protein PHE09_17755 [Oscillospiraceae bacterium]|nr:hypothetical protein [Oscillospiraceae bacterium]